MTTADETWRALAHASFAVLGHTTATGAPRTSGVVYQTVGRHLYVAVAPDGWKARQIATGDQVSVTVPVRRGGVLALLFPIPPATISFSGRVTVHTAGAPEIAGLLDVPRRLLPPARRDSACVLDIVPEGHFLTYGISVGLLAMRDPAAARARVPVGN